MSGMPHSSPSLARRAANSFVVRSLSAPGKFIITTPSAPTRSASSMPKTGMLSGTLGSNTAVLASTRRHMPTSEKHSAKFLACP